MNILTQSDRVLEINPNLEACELYKDKLGDSHITGCMRLINPKFQPWTWNNILNKYIVNPMPQLISRTGNKDNISQKNYLGYLSFCYANHIIPVITPDIIWFTIMQELSGWVKDDPEKFRHLFTVSKEKTDIIILTDDVTKINLHLLLNALKEYIPTSVDSYLPKFSTSDQMSQNAFVASFADMVSPFYSYSTMLCGFPKIIVKGTAEDWELLLNRFNELPSEFQDDWYDMVAAILVNMVNFDPEFYEKIFVSQRCGSGGEVEVDGWFTKLFRKQPKGMRKPENFASHIARVDYKNIETERKFSLFYGIFENELIDNVLYPKFESAIFERF